MPNISSDLINSFPSTKRASVNKLMTENSVTRLINRLVDVDGFVITTGLEDVDFKQDIDPSAWLNKDFEFVIRGYYFSIAKGSYGNGLSTLLHEINFNPSDTEEHWVTATIFIDNSDKDFPELWGQEDEDDKYLAITFSIDDNIPTAPQASGFDVEDYEAYSFVLVRYMQNDAGTWGVKVPLDSLFKFSSRSIANIDGGEISL